MRLTTHQQPSWVRPTIYVASILIVVGLIALGVVGFVHAGLWLAIAAAVLMIAGILLWLIAGIAYRRAGGERIR
jgi:membrane-bound ClpP family serine protease